ncbi:MAG: formate dehydrogenase [Desulfovibrio sp.]|nr:MAG: formate dehydrogenase [Desulfovibrio sp.]
MASTAQIEVRDGNIVAAVQDFLGKLLADQEIAGIFTPRQLEAKGTVMPALITSADKLATADPLAPSFPLNSARQVAQLTRGDLDGGLVAVMRPCEIRAFVELIKLNQGSLHNLVLVGVDCYGAYDNQGYRRVMENNGDSLGLEGSNSFIKKAAAGEIGAGNGVPGLARACLACEHPVSPVADLTIGLMGADLGSQIFIEASTPKGEGLLSRLELKDAAPGDARDKAIEALVAKRKAYRDAMFEETAEATATPEKLADYLAGCINCYNCRVACPVCYCRECVFVTDVFSHEPWQYMGWARKKGALRMPTDTMLYHLTRLAHMSTACIGCGQCSNACPNDIPVMELFRLGAHRTQEAFEYEAGRSPEEAPPLSVFQEKEFSEVTGGLD